MPENRFSIVLENTYRLNTKQAAPASDREIMLHEKANGKPTARRTARKENQKDTTDIQTDPSSSHAVEKKTKERKGSFTHGHEETTQLIGEGQHTKIPSERLKTTQKEVPSLYTADVYVQLQGEVYIHRDAKKIMWGAYQN